HTRLVSEWSSDVCSSDPNARLAFLLNVRCVDEVLLSSDGNRSQVDDEIGSAANTTATRCGLDDELGIRSVRNDHRTVSITNVGRSEERRVREKGGREVGG